MRTNKKKHLPSFKLGFIEKIRRNWEENIKIVKLKKKIEKNLPDNISSKELFQRFNEINQNIVCAHNPSHALEFIIDMLMVPKDAEGVFVECGCFMGGSTAKFSVIAKILNRDLIIFDSFEGLPENKENHETSLQGHSIRGWFEKGAFSASLEKVKNNIKEYGEIDVCRFVPGWFEKTMPNFSESILAGFIDVDLASSTKTCLKFLYPKLINGGVLCSQDGDFPLVLKVFEDKNFWNNYVGVEVPQIEGLGEKISRIRKSI